MIKFILHPLILSIIPLGILLISLIVSIKSKNFKWLQRSGSIVTIFGTLLLLRVTITANFEQEFIKRTNYAFWASDKESKERKEQEKDIKKEIDLERFGLAMVLVGTVIWGYGDLLKRK